MNRQRSWKTATCLIALVLASGVLGGLVGRRWTRMEFERRSDPSHWNETAMREFQRIVKPTPEQGQKIQGYLNGAVEELKTVRAETIQRSAAIVMRLVEQIEKELSAEQRRAFERIKPKQSDLSNLKLLEVEPRRKR